MFHSVWLPRPWRARGQVVGDKAAGKHHWDAYSYVIAETEGRQAGMSAWLD